MRKLFEIRVTYNDGDETYTDIWAKDIAEIEEYYIGEQFTHCHEELINGKWAWVETKHTAIKVDVLKQ